MKHGWLAALLWLSFCASTQAAEPAQAVSGRSAPVQIWTDAATLRGVPRQDSAWTAVDRWAARAQPIVLHHRDGQGDITLLAATYQAIAENDTRRQARLRRVLLRAPGSERIPHPSHGDGESLALARNLPALVISANLLDLRQAEPDANAEFSAWLRACLHDRIGRQRRSLVSTHEQRPNNWGTHAGAARIAIALYLNDRAELERAARVLRGWLGEGEPWSAFRFRDRTWQADPARPLGINAAGAQRYGHNLDGVIGDDQRRAGAFAWPPPHTNYAWEALQGAVLQAQFLSDNGYPAWAWGDAALLRAVRWLIDTANYPPTGDDLWLMPLIDRAYGTRYSQRFPDPEQRPGKSVGFTRLTHPPAVPAPR